MGRYSPEGYIKALRMRQHKTILVEGRSDRKAVARLMHRFAGGERKKDPLIDTAEMIKSPCGSSLGNREKVELVHALSSAAGQPLAAFVDREFRDVCISPVISDTLGRHQVLANDMFWTRGHSTENYLLTLDCISHILAVGFAEDLPVGYSQLLEAYFDSMLVSATAISLAAYNVEVLERMRGLLKPSHWTVKPPSDVELNISSVQHDIAVRGVSSHTSAAVMNDYVEFEDQIKSDTDNTLRRWLCHGHLGTEAIWSAVAAVLAQDGIEGSIVEKIANGWQDMKHQIACDKWCENCFDGLDEAPTDLIAWLTS